ncbi:nucleoside hydrolase, partial [Photobacterium damselae subsp. damselae]|nr:nucleoside hydrolase [Photobacterium damselae subsp. damselae]
IDEWSIRPSQQVGVDVDEKQLLALYQQTIVNYSYQFEQ